MAPINYPDWSKTVRIYLRSIDKDDHITNEPPLDNSQQPWLRENARLFLHIWNSIEGEVINLYSHYELVKELMDYLDFLYYGKRNISHIYEVCKVFIVQKNKTCLLGVKLWILRGFMRSLLCCCRIIQM